MLQVRYWTELALTGFLISIEVVATQNHRRSNWMSSRSWEIPRDMVMVLLNFPFLGLHFYYLAGQHIIQRSKGPAQPSILLLCVVCFCCSYYRKTVHEE